MDHKSISANERKWKDFLSSIKTFKCLSTNNLTITTESDIECLATTFANKLRQEKDDNVVVKGNQDVPQTDTNEHVKETSAQSADDINPEVPQTDTNEHVTETSAQSVDAIFPEVPHTDTNEHVKETFAQSVDSRDGNTHTPSKKNDMDKPSSKWSISNLAEYFIFENCVTKIEMPTMFSPYRDDIYKMVQKDILCRLQIVKSIDLKEEKCDSHSKFLRQLMSITNIEAEVDLC
jgi:hypothetical protein